MSRLKAIIFDVDGTLVDSNDLHAQSWVEALTECGYDVKFEDIRCRLGMGGDNLLPEVIGKEKDSPEGKRLGKTRKEIFLTKKLFKVAAFPDVPALFQRVHDSGRKAIICSSSEKDELEKLLLIAGVTELADAITSSSDAGHSKPDPDPIQVALKKAGCSPEEAVMVGDSPYDVSAAQKAGVSTVALRSGGFSDDDLKDAVGIYNDPADLLAHFDESPLGKKD